MTERYGNLFEMYANATGEDPYTVPMRIAPTCHFTMGGLWSDYDLQTSIPGLFVGGECGSNYHGANRLGANSTAERERRRLVHPAALGSGASGGPSRGRLPDDDDEVVVSAVTRARERVRDLLTVGGSTGPEHFHRELGEILYAGCGVTRTAQGPPTRSTASGTCGPGSGSTSGSPARALTSTTSSSTPAGWRTSSNWPS